MKVGGQREFFIFRVREVELVLGRTKTSTREKDEKIESLQKRYE
jgi:hypothetical protein